jgi:hypothetical protein
VHVQVPTPHALNALYRLSTHFLRMVNVLNLVEQDSSLTNKICVAFNVAILVKLATAQETKAV